MKSNQREASWLENLWFGPSWVFMKYSHLLRQIDFDEERVRTQNAFQPVREMLAAANMALGVQHQTGLYVHVQLAAKDPPDFFLFRSQLGENVQPMITFVEHTSYRSDENRGLDLEAQLRSTKLKYPHEFTYDYILLIEMDGMSEEDVDSVRDLVDEKGITYKVWMMDGALQDDDEELWIATLNTPFPEIRANLRAESERFPEAPPAFHLKMSRKDNRVAVDPFAEGEDPRPQPYPWPDPVKGLPY